MFPVPTGTSTGWRWVVIIKWTILEWTTNYAQYISCTNKLIATTQNYECNRCMPYSPGYGLSKVMWQLDNTLAYKTLAAINNNKIVPGVICSQNSAALWQWWPKVVGVNLDFMGLYTWAEWMDAYAMSSITSTKHHSSNSVCFHYTPLV